MSLGRLSAWPWQRGSCRRAFSTGRHGSRASGLSRQEGQLGGPARAHLPCCSPALLLQGHAVDPAVGTQDVELPGLGQQLHMPHLVGAAEHGLAAGTEANVTSHGTRRGGRDKADPGRGDPKQFPGTKGRLGSSLLGVPGRGWQRGCGSRSLPLPEGRESREQGTCSTLPSGRAVWEADPARTAVHFLEMIIRTN